MERPNSADASTLSAKQRIEQRRAKLDATLAAKKAGSEEGGVVREGEPKVGAGEEQIRRSRKNIEALKTRSEEEVTLFRVQADQHESTRRSQEEHRLRERLQNKADEAAASGRRDSSVLMKWNSLFQKTVPQDLLEAINKQKEACGKIIESKDRLISDLKEELKNKDEEYVRALKSQASAIDQLIATMHKRTKDVVNLYSDELEAIEAAFLNERKELLESQQGEIDTMTDRRRNVEDQNMRKRQEKVEEWQQRLHEIHETYGEYYNKLKCQLQTEIQGLEQQLEEMRALYQLNAEKLNYNLQVLSERVKENDKAIATHKRKLARLQDVLSGLITKYSDTDKRFRQENNVLTESYRRITEQYKDLQLKFQYFERADMEKYKQVWSMNEAEAMQLVNHCLHADRVLFEQQLGVEWKPPEMKFWQDDELEQPEEAAVEDQEEPNDQELSEGALKVFEMLREECGFLVESRVTKTIQMLEETEPDTDQQQLDALQLEAIWTTLGVKNRNDILKMMTHFTVPAGDDGEPVLVSQQDCIRALSAFVEQQNACATAASSKKSQQSTFLERAKRKRQRDEKEFWQRLSHVIPDGHYRVWGALEDGLEKYLKQLQDRAKLIDETDAIRQQNDELRALLNTYMQSKINDELFHPPQLTVASSAS
ncbi:Dynein regulatory complex protein 1 [Diplonema papillatum]|nr:Dynein regulatory complex protein 1 [Diplonema papillatum]